MKITKISIKNYRSCADTSFEPHGSLSVLIGPNGSGKTNILSALRLLPALVHGSARRFDEPDSIASPCELRVEYEHPNGTVTYQALINIVTSEKNQDEIVQSKEEWWVPSPTGRKRKISIPSSFLREITSEHPLGLPWRSGSRQRRVHLLQYLKFKGLDEASLSLLTSVVEFVTKITYYSASQFTNPGSAPVSFEVESEDRKRIGISLTGHKRLLFDIYQEFRQKSKTYNEFISLIGAEGVGLIESLEFDEIQTSSSNYSVMTGGKVVRKEKKNLLVVPRVKIGGNSLSPSQLSEGSFKTLALIFYLVTDKSELLMIEEPEVCVHHGLLTSIVELIKVYSAEKQIFVSTHSDLVLDKVDVENVFRVTNADKGTVVSSIRKNMSARELSALRQYLNEEGSLGEYWRHGDLEQS